MTAAELTKVLNREGVLSSGKFRWAIVVKDARNVYGRTDLLVVPKAGTGQQWVDASRVKLPGRSS